jgi:hypothetical protein
MCPTDAIVTRSGEPLIYNQGRYRMLQQSKISETQTGIA